MANVTDCKKFVCLVSWTPVLYCGCTSPVTADAAALLSGEPSMVKMGRLVKEELGIAHYGCADHRLEKTAQRFYKHPGVETSLSRAKAVVTFIHKSSQVTASPDHVHVPVPPVLSARIVLVVFFGVS